MYRTAAERFSFHIVDDTAVESFSIHINDDINDDRRVSCTFCSSDSISIAGAPNSQQGYSSSWDISVGEGNGGNRRGPQDKARMTTT